MKSPLKPLRSGCRGTMLHKLLTRKGVSSARRTLKPCHVPMVEVVTKHFVSVESLVHSEAGLPHVTILGRQSEA